MNNNNNNNNNGNMPNNGKPMQSNNPMNLRNFLSNIGTPSFSIAQIPQPILQSLTPVQLRTIQQRHQQLLAARIQQQQQQQQMPNNDQVSSQSPPLQASQLNRTGSMGGNNQSPAAIMQQMNVQQRLAQMSEQTKQATAQALQQRQRQQQQQFDQRKMQLPNGQMPSQSQPQMQQQQPQPQMQQPGPPPPPPQQQQQQQQQQQGVPRNAGGAPMINLPPQISNLPLPQQLQVLNSLKEQAISKGNPSIVSAIMLAQKQVQEKLQRQIQQQQQLQNRQSSPLQQQQPLPPQQQQPPPLPPQQQQLPPQQQQPLSLPPQQMNNPNLNPNLMPNMPNNVSGSQTQFINMSGPIQNQMNNMRNQPPPQPMNQRQRQRQPQQPPQPPLPPAQMVPQNIPPQNVPNNALQDQMSAIAASVQQKSRGKSKSRKTPTADKAQLVTKQSVRKPSTKSTKRAYSQSLNGVKTTPLPVPAALQIPTNMAPLSMPKLELPDFRTIKYDPPEMKLPYVEYWSEKKEATTDSLLYEQFIQRDKQNQEGKEKEKRGYEPFSIYGFSNREYMAKLYHTLKYYQELKNTRMESITNTAKDTPSASIWGPGYSGYGNGITNTTTQIIPGFIDETELDELAIHRQAMNETSEDLVPIRLEFDQERDKFFLRDTFLWNRNDSVVPVKDFAREMVKDYRFNESYQHHLCDVITQSIREQLQEFQSNPYDILKRKRLGGDDLRIRIKLDIVVGQNQLIDQFEWDISNPDNCAEEFAENLCQELQLPGEFNTAIAHSIREQVHMYHKSLALLGYKFDGSPVEDDDIRSRLLPVITLDDTFRLPSDTKNYTPNLIQISIAELERLDKDKDRDTRRKRRQGRFNRRGNTSSNIALNNLNGNNGMGGSSGGPIIMTDNYLPDVADIPRTFRTPIPTTTLPGGIDMGPSVNSYTLETVTEYKSRLTNPDVEMPPCYVVDNIPGKMLLVSIKLPNEKQTESGNTNATQDFKQESELGSVPIQKSNSKKTTKSPLSNASIGPESTVKPEPSNT